MLFAWGIGEHGALTNSGFVHGLKLAAVAVVAQAVWGMSRSLCPDATRAGIAIVAALLTLLVPGALAQLVAILAAGLVGWMLVKTLAAAPSARVAAGATQASGASTADSAPRFTTSVSRRAGMIAIMVFVALLVLLPLWASVSGSAFAALISATSAFMAS